MAMNLARKANGNGYAMAYTGETPWHKEGKKFDRHFTRQEAFDAAEFNFTVDTRPVTYTVDGVTYTVPDKKVTFRADNKRSLGVVGDGYNVLNYPDIFGDFTDALIGEGNAIVETAGLIGNGERAWMQMELPGDITLDNGKRLEDTVKKYLLITSSHDGSIPLTVRRVARRVVCQNTLIMALSEKDHKGVTIRHTASAAEKMLRAKEILIGSDEYYREFSNRVNAMVNQKVTPSILSDYLNTLIPDRKEAKNNTRTENVREQIVKLYMSGKGQDIAGVKGTIWALYNGVTEYTDYVRTTRGTDEQERQDNRLESVLYGSGAELKNDAFELAYKMST